MLTKKSLIAVVFLLFVACYLVWPSPIEPAAYSPSKAISLTGVWQTNNDLQRANLWGNNQLKGPEDVAIDASGRLYGGTVDGKIMRISANGEISVFADTGGRPLGLHFDNDGNLIIADALKGLLKATPDGHVSTLTTEADGIPFGFTDDLDITQDGIIIFSDASSRWGVWDYKLDAMEAKPYGRLLAFNPANGVTETLMDNLYFANGVALAQDDSFVLVNETWRYRIIRYWLKGPRAGQHDIFIDQLPGFPDGISSNKQGTFWLALAAPRNPLLDATHPYPWIKKQLAKLPKFLQPKAKPYGFVVALDENGNVKRTLHDPDGSIVSEITSVEQFENRLLFGTLSGGNIGEIKSPY